MLYVRRFLTMCLAYLCYACPVLADDWFAYIDSDTLNAAQAINLSNDEVVATIGGEFASPTFIAATPDGSKLYYTNQAGNFVGIIDRATNTVVGSIPVGLQPIDIAINSAGTRAYVTNGISNTVSVIDLTTNTVIATIPIEAGTARGIAITPDGTRAFVVYVANSIVTVIDLLNNVVINTIPGFPNSIEIAINPQGTKAFVTALDGNYRVINLANNAVTGPFSTGGTGSRGIDITNDGSTAFIVNSTSNTVTVIDLNTNTLVPGGVIAVGTAPFDVVLSPDGSRVYAINNGSSNVSVINTATNTVIATIGVDVGPRSMAVTPDGTLGYVNNITADGITVINLQTNTVIPAPQLQSPFNVPTQLGINPTATLAYFPNREVGSILGLTIVDIATNTVAGFIPEPNNAALRPSVVAITPDGTRAYVPNQVNPATAGFVTVFDLVANVAITTIPVGGAPYGIALTPDGTRAYVANLGSNVAIGTTLSIIDTASNTVIGAIDGFLNPNFIAITPDGSKAYVSNLNLQQRFIYVVDLATNAISKAIPVETGVEGIAITPDGTKAYFANNIAPGNSVGVIDTATDTIVDEIIVGPNPANLSVTPDGKKVYVTVRGVAGNPGNQVVVIDTATNTIINSIPVISLPFGIAITPDQAPVAAFSVNRNTAEQATIFDASASFSPVGFIERYLWDFGDGSLSAVTSNPIISHTYQLPGNYTVTLTVVNTAGTSTTQVFTGQTLSRNGGPSATTSQSISIAPFVFPPTNVKAKQFVKEHLTLCGLRNEFINVLKWRAPTTGHTPVEYRIYRNQSLTDLAGTVPGNKRKFVDRDRRRGKTYTYYIVSVDSAGSFSDPVSITVRPFRCRR